MPVTRLYDRGITVVTSELLRQHIGEISVILNPESAKSLGVQPGDLLQVNGVRSQGYCWMKPFRPAWSWYRAVWAWRSGCRLLQN